MRILLICHSYAPQVSPRAFRWSALCEHWVKFHRAQIDVVASPHPGSPEAEVLNGVHVHRVGSKIDGLRASSRKPNWLRTIYRHTWKRLQWPDHAALWIKPATAEALKLARANDYDWLISVSHPFSGHIVGLKVKQRHPDLDWLVDIGDPFAFMEKPAVNNQLLFKPRNFRAEGRILSLADKISVTTTSTERMYLEHFPQSAGKTLTIPPLYRPQASQRAPRPHGSVKRISFLGTLYKDIRSPKPLLQFFSAYMKQYPEDKVELHFYGQMNDCMPVFEPYHRFLGKTIFLHGLVSQAEALEAIDACDVLVNIGNENIYQLPSKTVECLASGKPLLNVITRKDDSSVELFNDYPCLFTVEPGQSLSPGRLREFSDFIHNPVAILPSYLEQKLKMFSMENVSAKYLELKR